MNDNKLNNNKLCIFDLDGTLLDTLRSISYYGNRALRENGLPEVSDYRMLVGDGRDVLIRRMLAAVSAPDSAFEPVRAVYDEGYEAEPLYLTEPYDGIKKLLGDLAHSGVRMAVLSNKPDNVVADVVDAFFEQGTFEIIRGQRDDTPRKPVPDSTLAIIKELGADEVWFIGDTKVDIETGKNAGVKTIGVLWGFRDEAELTAAGADYIAKTPEEILAIVKGENK